MTGIRLHDGSPYLEDVVHDVDLVSPYEQEGEGIQAGAGLGQQLEASGGVGSIGSKGGEDGLGVPGGLIQTGLPKQLLVIIEVLLGGGHDGASSSYVVIKWKRSRTDTMAY